MILNSFDNITLSKFSYHCLGACFKAYNNLTSLQTLFPCPLITNPSSCFYKPFHQDHHFKKVILTSF